MKMAYERHQVTSYPTPLPIDLLFYEIRDSQIVANRTFTYGDSHPDTKAYPNHILVLVKPEANKGNSYTSMQEWYYAADRDTQDLYNFESTIADIEGTKFDAVKRTYVFRRDDYDPEELQMGVAMPNIPVGRFIDSHVLAIRQQVRSSDAELDSMFITEVRTYMKRCSITMIQTEDFFGIGGSKVSNWYYRGEVIDGSAVEVHFASPNSGYWGWQDDGTQRDGQQISENWYIISIISSILDAIDGYEFLFPTFSNLDLPRRILSTQVTYNVAKGEGNVDQDAGSFATGKSVSLSIGLADSCNSSISISPELAIIFDEPNGNYLPAMVYAFFLPQPATLQNIIDKVSALHGSAVTVYSPADTASGIITLISSSANVTAKANASVQQSFGPGYYNDSWERSTGIDKSVSQTTQYMVLNGIAGGIPLINSEQTDDVSAAAAMSVWIAGSAGSISSSAITEDLVEVSASVKSPGTSSASPGSVGSSSGDFITSLKVEYYRFERVKIFVEVTTLGAHRELLI